jgi:glycosyltransferase involved in cell wall biosynthesis
LSSLNLLICPSAEFDPFPTVLLESAQMGVPAVAARVGGAAEIIENTETGWLFEPHNSRQAAAILEQLIHDPRRCRQAGERACRRILSQFPVTKMVADYLKVYSTVTTHV